MTRKNYLADSSTLAGEAIVVAVGAAARGPFVVLDQTWFHPQGGGQKADVGTIGGAPVVHVAHGEGGAVLHHLAAGTALPAVGARVAVAVSAAVRDANARLHTAGHLLAAVGEHAFSQLRAVQGHHWPGEARVEFQVAGPVDVDAVVARLREDVRAAIGGVLRVQVEGDPFTQRSIRIGEFAAVPCGGTHVTRLGALGLLVIRSAKVKKEVLRVSYDVEAVAGSSPDWFSPPGTCVP